MKTQWSTATNSQNIVTFDVCIKGVLRNVHTKTSLRICNTFLTSAHDSLALQLKLQSLHKTQ